MSHPWTFFVTGTDTAAGKTFVSCAILEAAARQGLTTAAVKPLAAGGTQTQQGLRNEDALALQKTITLPLAYDQINPVCLKEAVAPHIAAAEEERTLTAALLSAYCRKVMEMQADFTLIEGAGGWLVPLNEQELLSGLVVELNVPVILVVSMRLGCLNHALLTAGAIRNAGVRLAGWIANQPEPRMLRYEENRQTLMNLLPAPLLAEVRFSPDGESGSVCADEIDISRFLTVP